MGTDLGCGSLWASLMLARIDQGPERVKPRDHGLEHPAHACVAACGVREGCACITPKPSLMKAPSGPRETHQPNRTRNPSGAGSKKRFVSNPLRASPAEIGAGRPVAASAEWVFAGELGALRREPRIKTRSRA